MGNCSHLSVTAEMALRRRGVALDLSGPRQRKKPVRGGEEGVIAARGPSKADQYLEPLSRSWLSGVGRWWSIGRS